jgi:anaerobic ribonucleoside-triphosphate reductase activating protein
MLKYTDTEVVFKEVPDEITLAINLSNCPIHCPGCHSPHLWENIGDELNENSIKSLIESHPGISCVSLMGGDLCPKEVSDIFQYVKNTFKDIKTSWYSGRNIISKEIDLKNFDFIKIGPYIESLGGLDKETTNQIMYKITDSGELVDITEKFRIKSWK